MTPTARRPSIPSQIQKAYGVDMLQQSGTTTGAINNGAGRDNRHHRRLPLSQRDCRPSIPLQHVWSAAVQPGRLSPTFASSTKAAARPCRASIRPARTTSTATGKLEEALDIEWAHAMAPMANIILYEANNGGGDGLPHLENAVVTARNNANVSVISMSWGGGGFSSGTNDSLFGDPV